MENQARFIQEDFCAFLEAMNYSDHTIQHARETLKEFTDWHDKEGITDFRNYNSISIQSYFMYQTRRSNKSRGGGLSGAYINKKLADLKLFERYLLRRYRFDLPIIFQRVKDAPPPIEILTIPEIKQLYKSIDTSTAFGRRDRAILSLYYGCGLRRAEGVRLTIDDVKLDQRILHIRKSKNGRERIVPMAITVMQDLKEYLLNARSQMKQVKTKALLIEKRGDALSYDGVYASFKRIVRDCKIDSIISKSPCLHTLRHSLGTHLLNRGMSLEQIGKILGHCSMESTQLYTHLNKQIREDESI